MDEFVKRIEELMLIQKTINKYKNKIYYIFIKNRLNNQLESNINKLLNLDIYKLTKYIFNLIENWGVQLDMTKLNGFFKKPYGLYVTKGQFNIEYNLFNEQFMFQSDNMTFWADKTTPLYNGKIALYAECRDILKEYYYIIIKDIINWEERYG